MGKRDELPAARESLPGDQESTTSIVVDSLQADKGASSMPDTDTVQGDGAGPGAVLDGIASPHEAAHEDFDAAIHAIDAAGNPVKKADGTFAKKRGRKADSKVAGSALPNPNAPAVANVPSIRSDVLTSEQAAKQIVNMFLNGAVMVFGEDWQPENVSEAKGLVFSLRDYFDIRGVPKFPPEMGLLIAFGAYALPRLQKEKTRSKIDGWKDKIKLFFVNRGGYG